MHPLWQKGSLVRVRHEGKLHPAEVEAVIDPPNDLGYVKEKYRVFLNEHMGGRGKLITVEAQDVMPSLIAAERQFEIGDRFTSKYGTGIVVGDPPQTWNGAEYVASMNSYEVKLDSIEPNPNGHSAMARRGTTILGAGWLEPQLHIPDHLVTDFESELKTNDDDGPSNLEL